MPSPHGLGYLILSRISGGVRARGLRNGELAVAFSAAGYKILVSHRVTCPRHAVFHAHIGYYPVALIPQLYGVGILIGVYRDI